MKTYSFKTKKEAINKHENLWLNEPNFNWDIFKNSKTGLYIVKRRENSNG